MVLKVQLGNPELSIIKLSIIKLTGEGFLRGETYLYGTVLRCVRMGAGMVAFPCLRENLLTGEGFLRGETDL